MAGKNVICRDKDFSIWPAESAKPAISVHVGPNCVTYDEETKFGFYVEPDEKYAEFFSVYLRYDENQESIFVLENSIGDFYQKEDANAYADIISKVLSVPCIIL